jgi:hypothetical protein
VGLNRELGDRRCEAYAWDSLGYPYLAHLATTHDAAGRPEPARDALQVCARLRRLWGVTAPS